MAYVLQLIERRIRRRARDEPGRATAAARFEPNVARPRRTTIWNTGCKSWYLDASGLPTAWPFTFDRFRAEMARPRFDDWIVHEEGR